MLTDPPVLHDFYIGEPSFNLRFKLYNAIGTAGTIWMRTHLHCNADYNTGNIATPVGICYVWDLAQSGADEQLTRM